MKTMQAGAVVLLALVLAAQAQGHSDTEQAERCDHIAIVPAMPRALAGDEGTPDHWLRITNPGGEGITFTVTGRNDAGTEFGTYRRELPAYRSVKVLMRDVEAAFDVSEPEGWWTLTVTGSGTQYTSATMKQGGRASVRTREAAGDMRRGWSPR